MNNQVPIFYLVIDDFVVAQATNIKMNTLAGGSIMFTPNILSVARFDLDSYNIYLNGHNTQSNFKMRIFNKTFASVAENIKRIIKLNEEGGFPNV